MPFDGERVRRLRRLRRWTQERLADEVGVSVLTVGQWESLKMEPSGQNLLRLAQVLGVSPLDLYEAGGGPTLKDLRRAAGLSQPDAAAIVQMSVDSVHRYETGQARLPDPYEFWADAYGVSVDVVAAAAERSWVAAGH